MTVFHKHSHFVKRAAILKLLRAGAEAAKDFWEMFNDDMLPSEARELRKSLLLAKYQSRI